MRSGRNAGAQAAMIARFVSTALYVNRMSYEKSPIVFGNMISMSQTRRRILIKVTLVKVSKIEV